jgi:hypothetical protein
MAQAARAASPAAPARFDGSEERRAETPLERGLAAVERHWPWALAALMLAAAALLLYMGRGLSFYYDDWDYVTHDYGGGVHSLLLAHNGHLSLFPVAVYKILFHLVGLDHYAVFRIVLLLLHLTCAGLVFVLASRRLARVPALLVTASILFLGAAWEDLLWAFQISYLLSIAGGLAAWVLLDRRDRLGDLGTMVAVGVSLGSSGLGIPILVGVVVELVWQRDWRRWFVVVIPALLYAVWYLHYGEDEITRDGLINSPGFAEDIAAAAFGGLAGRGLDWGRPLALLGALGILVNLARTKPVSGRLIGLLATGVSLWALTAAARSTISSPETGRYIYLGAVVILLIGAEVMGWTASIPGRASARAYGLGALVVLLFVVTGLTILHNGASSLRGTSRTVTAELGALELASSHAPATYQPDPERAPQIVAGPYLHTVRAIGSSPADTPAEVAASDAVSRGAADGVLIALDAPVPVATGTLRPSSLAPAPSVEALTSGSLVQHGGCVLLTPTPGTSLAAALVLPPGGVAIYDRGSVPVSVAVRRFGEAFQVVGAPVAAHHPAALVIAPDASPQPWQAQLSTTSPLQVCGLRP